MRILSVRLINWRQHQDLTIYPGEIHAYTGNNNAGKSSLLNAFIMGLTGRCQYTDDHGKGGSLRTVGATNPWEILIATEHGTIRRTEQGLVVPWAPSAGSQKAAQAALEEMCFGGKPTDQVRLALQGGRYFTLEEDRRKPLLARLLGLDVTADEVLSEIRLEAEKAGLPLVEAVDAHVGRSQLAGLQRAHTKVYQARTKANGALEQAEQHLRDLVRMSTDNQLMPPEEGQQLARRQQDLEAEVERLDQAIGQRRGKLEEWAKCDHYGGEDQAELTRHQARLQSVGPLDLDETRRRIPLLQSTVEQLQKSLGVALDFERNQNRIQAGIAKAQAEVKALESDLKAAGMCKWAPTVVCAGAEARQADSRAKLEKAQAECNYLSSQLLQLEAPDIGQDEQREQLDSATAELRKLQEALDHHVRLQDKIAQTNRRLTLVEASRQEAERERPAVERDLADLERRRAEKAALLGDVRDVLEAGRLAYKHQNLIAKQRTEVSRLQRDQATLNRLVDFFGPEGFPARVLANTLGKFQNQVNSTLQAWGLQVRYDEKLDLTVSRDGGPWLDYASLSLSDTILVSLAHQVGFASISQCGIVLVDNIEALDFLRQRVLFDACLQVRENTPGLAHIQLFGVRCVQPPPGIDTYQLGEEPF